MKRIEKINLGLKIFISLSGVTLSILHFVPGMNLPKIWSYVATIFLPFVLDPFFKLGLKLSIKSQIAFEIFLFFAMVLGIDLDFYKLYPIYDKIVHTASGILEAVIAFEVLEIFFKKQKIKFEKNNVMLVWFSVLFVMAAVALVSVLWECYEFSYDQLFDGHMQELLEPGVKDTMWDIIVALFGGAMVLPVLIMTKKSTKKSN